MIKIHKWTINGIFIILIILGMAFFFSHEYYFDVFFKPKWIMIITVSIIYFNFLSSIIKLYRMHTDLTLYQHLQLFLSPVLFIIIAWYSLTKRDPILGFVLLILTACLACLQALFTNG